MVISMSSSARESFLTKWLWRSRITIRSSLISLSRSDSLFWRQVTASLNGVKVLPLDGLLVEFAVQQNAHAVVRGLRAVSDFEFEFQMALMNRKLEATVETIFLMPKEEYTYLSSRIVKEIARLGGDVAQFVPACVVEGFARKLER